MAGRKRKVSWRSVASRGADDIYQDMLAEAAMDDHAPSPRVSPPRKRKRPGEKHDTFETEITSSTGDVSGQDNETLEFEGVQVPAPHMQTRCQDSDDEDTDDEDIEFEDVDINKPSTAGPNPTVVDRGLTDIELNLTARKSLFANKSPNRRKPISKEERQMRLDIHKTHVLCLLVHCARRNRWCGDSRVHESLRPLLTPKILTSLRPRAHLSQFGQTESLKDGLQQLSRLFKIKFQIVERGLRKSLWAKGRQDLENYELPDQLDSCIGREEFQTAAATLCGSRDVGAQLFCALLRCAGLQARLVCSLQPLTFLSGGPTLPSPREQKPRTKPTAEESLQNMKMGLVQSTPKLSRAANRRLANSAKLSPPISVPPSPTRRSGTIKESPYPVYWVEVLDVAHQKWQPVDPLVTESMWKPTKLEPPALDPENTMSYVIAFESNGVARDVTRRYATAFVAKTRKLRIESAMDEGERWWHNALKPLTRSWPTDLEQIETHELAAIASREPLPRNVADFKNHPTYALERHLRRHEVLIPTAHPTGTVGVGNKGPLEKIYRRGDVRVARSRDRWYRLGREVKPMEIPVKFLPRRANARIGDYVDDGYGVDERDAAGTPLFMLEQTVLFRHPPVVKGQVPKNKFGNIEVYAKSMVPDGGVWIADDADDSALAARAAYMLGVDYAPALMGFHFKGRQGTAVLNGVVVAQEYEEAVRATMSGLEEVDAQRGADMRAAVAVRMWKRFLVALRIRERIYAGVDLEERERDGEMASSARTVVSDVDRGVEATDDNAFDKAPSDVTEEYLMDEDDMGGGFLVD